MEARDGAPPLGFELHPSRSDRRASELGRVTWDGLPIRTNDIMPFVYSLHMYLAMSGIGDWILGIVALIWTHRLFRRLLSDIAAVAANDSRKDFSRAGSRPGS